MSNVFVKEVTGTPICGLFGGEWGKVGICTQMREARNVIDISCKPTDQRDWEAFRPGAERSLQLAFQVLTGEPILVSRCVWVSKDAGVVRGIRGALVKRD